MRPSARPSPRPSPRLPLVLVVAALVACSGPAGPSPQERASEIRAARVAISEPAVALAESAATLADALDQVRDAASEGADRRATLAVAATTGPLAAAEDALSGAEAVRLAGSGPDIAAAANAWDDARDAQRTLVAYATRRLETVLAAADADQRLEELVATWDEAGARSTQLSRLEATAAAARSIAGDLQGLAEEPGCAGELARRTAAAEHVATASEELRELVAARRGEAFDARRAALREDPYGLGAPLATLDADALGCEQVAPIGYAEEVRAAIDRVVGALDPHDLRPSTTG